jgi:hypothetical protein
MPAGIGRKYVGDMLAAIGSVTPSGRKLTRNIRSSAASFYGAAEGMITADAMESTLRNSHSQIGRKVTQRAIGGAAGLSLLSTNRSTGNYKPAPINPMPSAQGSGRYA